MKGTLIHAALDWPSQRADFEPDGSLRDIYVQDTTAEDWKVVVAMILDGGYGARIERKYVEAAIPITFETLFDWVGDRHSMSFTVGSVVLTSYFFTPTEIEFSFSPKDVTETALHDLLSFMVDVGDVTKKRVIMTPENCRGAPIFRYDSGQNQLQWIPPDSSHRTA